LHASVDGAETDYARGGKIAAVTPVILSAARPTTAQWLRARLACRNGAK
jgi:hypothetical protein